MRIKLRTIYAGPLGTFQPGAVVDFPEAQAEALVAGGYATPVVEPAPSAPTPPKPAAGEPELAVLPPTPEKAVAPRGRRQPKGG